MPLIPFNGADPSPLLTILSRYLDKEQLVSLLFRCDARSINSHRDPWQLLQQALSHSDVYQALGIDSLPAHVDFDAARGLEVIGTVANLLYSGHGHLNFVENLEAALAESRRFLDTFFQRDYNGAEAYSYHGKWCDWFQEDGWFDVTIILRNRDEWWLLAVTSDPD